MTQEEKAKRYDEALEIAKKNYVTAQDLCEGSKIGVECFKNTLESIFPELKESEDERILELIKKYIHYNISDMALNADHITREQLEDWLEKQSKKEYALKSFKDEDVRKFMQRIEKEAKAYDFNLPNRSYDIYAFAKDLLSWLEKQSEQKPTDWSEADKEHIDSLLKRLEGLCRNKFERTRFAISEDEDWLKSLKERIKEGGSKNDKKRTN